MLDTKEKWISSSQSNNQGAKRLARILNGLMTDLSQSYHISDPTDERGIHMGPSHIPFQRRGHGQSPLVHHYMVPESVRYPRPVESWITHHSLTPHYSSAYIS